MVTKRPRHLVRKVLNAHQDEPFEGVVIEVRDPFYPDTQHLWFGGEEPGYYLTLPPIEYTVRPGDRVRLESVGGGVTEGTEIDYVQINDGPRVYVQPLWDDYYLDHPRYWLGETEPRRRQQNAATTNGSAAVQ